MINKEDSASDNLDERAGRGIASGWQITKKDNNSAVSKESITDDKSEDDDITNASDQKPQISNISLVLLGVIGGLMLIYTWGWIVIANFYDKVNSATAAGSGLIGAVLQTAYFWSAPFAPGLWFLIVILLHRKSSVSKLGFWLILGAVLLLPLPLFLGSSK